jgi:plastocyanin
MTHISIGARRSAAVGAGALLLTSTLAACGSSTDSAASTAAGTSPDAATTAPAAPAAPAPTAQLKIKKNAVSPAKLKVSPGEKVQIVNSDPVTHELVDSKDKLSSGTIKTNATGALTAPSKAGTFKLVDPHHSTTKLTLIVS